MANKQIEMRKVKQIFKLYSGGVSKRQISSRLGLSHNTMTKSIAFFTLTVKRLSKKDRNESFPTFLFSKKPTNSTYRNMFFQFNRFYCNGT